MRHISILNSILVLPLALAACDHDYPGQTPPPLGAACADAKIITLPSAKAQRLPPGKYAFWLRSAGSVDTELVSGGGGGGAARDVHDTDSTGAGGAAGQFEFKSYALDEGLYFIQVGANGVGGISPRRPHEPVQGTDGGNTILGRCASGMPLAFLRGGSGGAGDGNPNRHKGSSGGSLRNPLTGAVVGTGGEGGVWQNDGKPASGNGAGGGGQGGTNTPGRKGGDGTAGYAVLTLVGER
jgi:hypothetical protein